MTSRQTYRTSLRTPVYTSTYLTSIYSPMLLCVTAAHLFSGLRPDLEPREPAPSGRLEASASRADGGPGCSGHTRALPARGRSARTRRGPSGSKAVPALEAGPGRLFRRQPALVALPRRGDTSRLNARWHCVIATSAALVARSCLRNALEPRGGAGSFRRACGGGSRRGWWNLQL